MTKIETKAQYDWAVKRVEELLPLVTDETPLDNPHSIELELLSNLVADYSEEHFALGEPTLVDVLKLHVTWLYVSFVCMRWDLIRNL